MCDGTIRLQDLPERIREYRAGGEADGARQLTPAKVQQPEEWFPLSEVEGHYVARVLAHTGGNKQAARAGG